MDDKLLKVKVVFDNVRGMREEISTLFEGLDGRISKLHEVYNDFIRNTKLIRTPDVKAFIFSLDSFYFQNSLLKREYKYLKDYYNIIINRMYGEYYKLYKLITDYIEKSHVDTKLNTVLKNKKYPKYDDLDEEKTYDFNLIVQLNEDIIHIVAYLINVLRGKEQSLQAFTTNQSYGLNVNNFVSTFNYEVIVLGEQINLYEKYLDFFYHVHEKLLKRLITKISLLEAQLNADIKFEGGLTGKRMDNKTLMDDINIQSLNKNAARDLRRSIVGQSSPSGSSSSEQEVFLPINHITLNTDIIEQSSSSSITIAPFSTTLNKSLAQQMFEPYRDITDEPSADEEEQDQEEDEPSADEEEQEDEPSADEQEEDEPSADEQEEDEPSADEQEEDEPSADEEEQEDEPSADEQEEDEPSADEQEEDEPSADEQEQEEDERSADEEEQEDEPSADQDQEDEPSADQDQEDEPSADEPEQEEDEPSADEQEQEEDEPSADEEDEPSADEEEKALAEVKAKALAEVKAKALAEAKAKALAEAKAKALAVAKAKAVDEAKAKAEEKTRIDEEARLAQEVVHEPIDTNKN